MQEFFLTLRQVVGTETENCLMSGPGVPRSVGSAGGRGGDRGQGGVQGSSQLLPFNQRRQGWWEKVTDLVQMLGPDSCGCVTVTSLTAVLPRWCRNPAAEAARCLAQLDLDQDGRVTYPEFLIVWRYRQLGHLTLP